MGMTSKEALSIDDTIDALYSILDNLDTEDTPVIDKAVEALHLLEKQEKGLVQILPCKLELGQKWYYIGFGTPIEFEIIDFNWWLSSGLVAETYGEFPNSSTLSMPFSYFGEYVFQTREEAEAKLAEMESSHDKSND